MTVISRIYFSPTLITNLVSNSHCYSPRATNILIIFMRFITRTCTILVGWRTLCCCYWN